MMTRGRQDPSGKSPTRPIGNKAMSPTSVTSVPLPTPYQRQQRRQQENGSKPAPLMSSPSNSMVSKSSSSPSPSRALQLSTSPSMQSQSSYSPSLTSSPMSPSGNAMIAEQPLTQTPASPPSPVGSSFSARLRRQQQVVQNNKANDIASSENVSNKVNTMSRVAESVFRIQSQLASIQRPSSTPTLPLSPRSPSQKSKGEPPNSPPTQSRSASRSPLRSSRSWASPPSSPSESPRGLARNFMHRRFNSGSSNHHGSPQPKSQSQSQQSSKEYNDGIRINGARISARDAKQQAVQVSNHQASPRLYSPSNDNFSSTPSQSSGSPGNKEGSHMHQQQPQQEQKIDNGHVSKNSCSATTLEPHHDQRRQVTPSRIPEPPFPISYRESIERAFESSNARGNKHSKSTTTKLQPKVCLYRDVFQVAPTASSHQIRIAYFKRGRQVLAEATTGSSSTTAAVMQFPSPDLSEEAKVRFQAVSMAYEILSQPQWKQFYDLYGLGGEVDTNPCNSQREETTGPSPSSLRRGSFSKAVAPIDLTDQDHHLSPPALPHFLGRPEESSPSNYRSLSTGRVRTYQANDTFSSTPNRSMTHASQSSLAGSNYLDSTRRSLSTPRIRWSEEVEELVYRQTPEERALKAAAAAAVVAAMPEDDQSSDDEDDNYASRNDGIHDNQVHHSDNVNGDNCDGSFEVINVVDKKKKSKKKVIIECELPPFVDSNSRQELTVCLQQLKQESLSEQQRQLQWFEEVPDSPEASYMDHCLDACESSVVHVISKFQNPTQAINTEGPRGNQKYQRNQEEALQQIFADLNQSFSKSPLPLDQKMQQNQVEPDWQRQEKERPEQLTGRMNVSQLVLHGCAKGLDTLGLPGLATSEYYANSTVGIPQKDNSSPTHHVGSERKIDIPSSSSASVGEDTNQSKSSLRTSSVRRLVANSEIPTSATIRNTPRTSLDDMFDDIMAKEDAAALELFSCLTKPAPKVRSRAGKLKGKDENSLPSSGRLSVTSTDDDAEVDELFQALTKPAPSGFQQNKNPQLPDEARPLSPLSTQEASAFQPIQSGVNPTLSPRSKDTSNKDGGDIVSCDTQQSVGKNMISDFNSSFEQGKLPSTITARDSSKKSSNVDKKTPEDQSSIPFDPFGDDSFANISGPSNWFVEDDEAFQDDGGNTLSTISESTITNLNSLRNMKLQYNASVAPAIPENDAPDPEGTVCSNPNLPKKPDPLVEDSRKADLSDCQVSPGDISRKENSLDTSIFTVENQEAEKVDSVPTPSSVRSGLSSLTDTRAGTVFDFDLKSESRLQQSDFRNVPVTNIQHAKTEDKYSKNDAAFEERDLKENAEAKGPDSCSPDDKRTLAEETGTQDDFVTRLYSFVQTISDEISKCGETYIHAESSISGVTSTEKMLSMISFLPCDFNVAAANKSFPSVVS